MRKILCHKFLPSLILLLLACNYCFSQTPKIDSLRTILYNSSDLSKQQKAIISLCEKNYSLPSDSLLQYILLGEKKFSANAIERFRLKTFYCYYLIKRGEIADAIEVADTLLKNLPSENNTKTIRHEAIVSLSAALIRNNQNKESIQQVFNLLQSSEAIHDTISILRSYTLLGWAYMENDQHNDAIKWLSKGVNYTKDERVLSQVASLFSNIASCYNNINRTDSAFYFVNRALALAEREQNLTVKANSLNIRAAMYIKQKNNPAAETDLKEALITREKIGDQLYTISDMAQLSSFYASINEPQKGIAIAKKGLDLAYKANNLSKLIFLNMALGENYNVAGDMQNYAQTLSTLINLKDSLYTKNSSEAIADMEAKYELQKKENIIIQQKYDLIRSRYFTIASISIFILSSLVLLLLYRNYRLSQQRKMQQVLAEQKKLSYEAVQMAEENERKRIAADLHDNLGSYAAAITSNVKYLKEGSIRNTENIITQLDENAQSMVTQLSDTIWVLKNEHLPLTKLADRFKVWMLRMMQNYPDIKYHYSENIINDIEFTPAKILNIFLILKECITNALKHSDAHDLKISFFSDKNWIITIEDNGKGFNVNDNNRGSGIDNIMKRVSESGWNVEWQKVNPEGTCVMISSNTTK